jgi:ribosomal protein L3 glutamine methyltransferase
MNVLRQRWPLAWPQPPDIIPHTQTPAASGADATAASGAGKDGLNLVRRILTEAKHHLTAGRLLVCEIGANRKAQEHANPKTECAWPETSDPNSVFIPQREQLPG